MGLRLVRNGGSMAGSLARTIAIDFGWVVFFKAPFHLGWGDPGGDLVNALGRGKKATFPRRRCCTDHSIQNEKPGAGIWIW